MVIDRHSVPFEERAANLRRHMTQKKAEAGDKRLILTSARKHWYVRRLISLQREIYAEYYHQEGLGYKKLRDLRVRLDKQFERQAWEWINADGTIKALRARVREMVKELNNVH